MVFGAEIPRAMRNLVRVSWFNRTSNLYAQFTAEKGERGMRWKDEGRSGRQEKNEGDDLSPSFCSPRLSLYTSSGYLSLPRFSFVRYSSSFSLLSSFHGTLVELRQSQGVVVLPRSPRLRVFVRLEESAGAHCPSLSPVSAPFLRNARHFLPSLIPPFLFCFFLFRHGLALSFQPSRPFLFFSLHRPAPPCVTLLPFYSTLAVCSLFGLFGPRKYHLPTPPTHSTAFACLLHGDPRAWEKILKNIHTLDFLYPWPMPPSYFVCAVTRALAPVDISPRFSDALLSIH